MAKRAAKSTSNSNRGGKRSGAGRKPKAITEIREALIAPMIATQQEPADVLPMQLPGCQARPDLAGLKSAAQFALDLFEQTMRDPGKALDLRLDCAREVMNRTLGKPRTAEAPAKDDGEGAEQVVVYMPDNGRGVAAG